MLNKQSLMLIALSTLFSVTSILAGPDSPGGLIEQAVRKLNPIVEEGHTYYGKDPARLYANISDLLVTFFDFDAFAKGVMGTHFSATSATQRADFAVVLQRSLVQTFSDGLISLGEYSATVLPSSGQNPQSKRAKVTVQVTSADAKHELIYSLNLGEDGSWQVRNLVFDGVNIGLTFRSQFANEVANSGGNIDDVIGNWEINIDQ